MTEEGEGEARIFKVRMNCASFHDIVVEAKNEEEAKNRAYIVAQCPSNGMEFGEFLPVEKDDEAEYR